MKESSGQLWLDRAKPGLVFIPFKHALGSRCSWQKHTEQISVCVQRSQTRCENLLQYERCRRRYFWQHYCVTGVTEGIWRLCAAFPARWTSSSRSTARLSFRGVRHRSALLSLCSLLLLHVQRLMFIWNRCCAPSRSTLWSPVWRQTWSPLRSGQWAVLRTHSVSLGHVRQCMLF